VDVGELQDYLCERVAPMTVRRVHRSFPGHSRETLIVETVEGDGYVVRVDHPGGPLVPIPLEVEYEVYARLWPSPVPVAEPLFYAEGVAFADGRPHMVRRLVDGSPTVPGLAGPGAEGAALRREVAFEVADKLAMVHSLDWHRWGLDEILDVAPEDEDPLRHDLRQWREIFARTRSDPFPMLTEGLYWLDEGLPAGEHRRTLLKGNNGLGEEIWRDGRIVALSDWELASIGEPAMDWAFSQGLLALHDADETLAHYAEVAGHAVDGDRLAWATVWIRVKASMTTNLGVSAYLDGHDSRSVLPVLGMGLAKRTERWLAESLGRDPVELGRALIESQRSPYLRTAG
jgi:aminoglycoside phosphotransferase (APT) family kinase protein